MPHTDKAPFTEQDFKPYSSYSQDGEDMLLRSLIEEKIPEYKTRKGIFIDIGAHHPYRFSNTAYFYEQGWEGINIEPTPQAIALFEQHRERDINLAIGVGAKQEKRTLYCFEDSALNSFDKEIAESYEAPVINKVEVDIYPLAHILDENLPAGTVIDFMNIDVAGLDIQLLESNDWEKYRPHFILVEDVDNLTGKIDASELYSFLTGKGYQQLNYKTPRTLIFSQK